MYHKLQYISQGTSSHQHITNIKQVLDAGCLWVQLRMKNYDAEEIEKTAIQVRQMCDIYNATFIMNDNVSIAKNCNADGVHLGLSDMPISEAREILGKDKIIGGTANTISDVVQRIKEHCNYIGLGPYRFTQTKEKLSPVLGLDEYIKIRSSLNEIQKQTPIYAIGGVLFEDIQKLTNSGIYGISVSGLITKSSNKKLLIEQLKSQIL